MIDDAVISEFGNTARPFPKSGATVCSFALSISTIVPCLKWPVQNLIAQALLILEETFSSADIGFVVFCVLIEVMICNISIFPTKLCLIDGKTS